MDTKLKLKTFSYIYSNSFKTDKLICSFSKIKLNNIASILQSILY
jgi:hypothetical protein